MQIFVHFVRIKLFKGKISHPLKTPKTSNLLGDIQFNQLVTFISFSLNILSISSSSSFPNNSRNLSHVTIIPLSSA